MTYKELMKEAEELYYRIGKESPFCAQVEARKFIASKIDECSDRDEHLNVLEWDEYKEFAPIKKEDYERSKIYAKEAYEKALEKIEKQYNEQGKYSPDYHKI